MPVTALSRPLKACRLCVGLACKAGGRSGARGGSAFARALLTVTHAYTCAHVCTHAPLRQSRMPKRAHTQARTHRSARLTPAGGTGGVKPLCQPKASLNVHDVQGTPLRCRPVEGRGYKLLTSCRVPATAVLARKQLPEPPGWKMPYERGDSHPSSCSSHRRSHC